MAAERQNIHLLENLSAISNDILVKLLDNKLTNEIGKNCLQTFLQIKRHTLYHLFQEGECCTCAGNRRNNKKLMCSKQWHFLYGSSNKSPCGKHRNCSCQYDAKANVRSSELDISLCSLLLLNSELVTITKLVEPHIYTIRKIRNCLAHNAPGSRIDEHSFKGLRKDLTVAIIQLARACSTQLAVQTEEKIRLAETPRETYRQICDACPQCTVLLENESLKINTSVSAFQETIERMNKCFTTTQQQRVSPDITEIRGRLLNDDYKNYIISNMDANLVIEVLKNKGFFSTSYADYLFDLDKMPRRSEQILKKILSEDNTFIKAFMDSLVKTKQTVIHDYIHGNDTQIKLHLTLDFDLCQPHPVGVLVDLIITLADRPDIQKKILDMLLRESVAGEINKLTMTSSKMSLDDTKEGSIIMRLKPESPDSVERFYNAYLDGRLRELIEEILKKTGVLDELIKDQVTVVVNISIGGINREPETFYELNWKFLVDELSPRSVAAFLWERGVLNINDIKEIFQKENATRFSQSNSLMHKLNLKSDDTIDDVRQCLLLTSQCYVLRELKDFISAKQESRDETDLSTNREKKRLALTIVNVGYLGSLNRNTTGAPMDVHHTSFNNYLGFVSPGTSDNVFKDVTKRKLDAELNKAVEQLETKEYSCVAVTISSHGQSHDGEQYVRCIPGAGDSSPESALYPVQEILKKFNSIALKEIQKIFIFQFYRAEGAEDGDGSSAEKKRRAEDRGIEVLLVDNSDDEMEEEPMASGSSGHDYNRFFRGQVVPSCIPESVVVFASSEGKEAYCSYDPSRSEEFTGGWLTSALSIELENMNKEMQKKGLEEMRVDFFKLLTKVNDNVSKREVKDKERQLRLKATATFNHQLTRPIIFKMKTHKISSPFA